MNLPIFNVDLKISKKIYEFYLRNCTRLDCFLENINFLTDVLFYSVLFSLYFIASKFCVVIAVVFYKIVSLLQKRFSRKRPYEFFNIEHINYSSKGHSFPSSHSAVAILIFLLYSSIPLSWLLITIPILRIISLNHWLSDVVAGILLALAVFVLLKLLIPVL